MILINSDYFLKILWCAISIYAQTLDGEIRHYRDNTGFECDAILHLPNGNWAAIEIKLGGEKLIEEGVTQLNSLKNKLASNSDEKSPFL